MPKIKQRLKDAAQLLGYEIKKFSPTSPEESGIDLSRLAGKDCLVAGPFLGEFGWELMQWQGYVRQLSKFYNKTLVFGRASSRYFYQDFATEYYVMDCDSWDTAGYELHGFDYDTWAQQFGDSDVLVADNRCYQLPSLFLQEFIPFGAYKQSSSYDVVVHARDIPMLAANDEKRLRNWPRERWDDLCLKLEGLRIAAVGVPELSYCPENATDLRGVDTEDLCSVLSSSTVCVGPSSGLMHLATLCQTPQLVWTSKEYTWGFGGTAYRYIRGWNPFATPVRVLTEMGIAPTADYIEGELRSFIATLPPRIPTDITDTGRLP